MNSNTKFIPDHVPSRQEMMDFVEGKLSPEDAEVMQALAEKDPFIADAIEGLQMAPVQASFDRIDATISASTQSTSWNAGSKLLTLVIALGVFATFFWWNQKNQNSTPALVAQQDDPLQTEIEREIEAFPEATQLVQNASPTEHHVVAHRSTDSSISVTISHAEGAEETFIDPYMHIVELPEVEPLPLPDDEESPVMPIRQSERIYHIEDYKVVDYRGKRSSEFKQWEIVPGGLPANMESADQDPLHQHTNMEVVAVPYVDYLEEAIVLFSTHKFKDCSKRLKTILDKYPDDINAQFYLALAQYNLGKNKKAKTYFAALKAQGSPTFNQEVDFYLAKTMSATGEKEEARSLLSSIANSTSFYATQAQHLLEELD